MSVSIYICEIALNKPLKLPLPVEISKVVDLTKFSELSQTLIIIVFPNIDPGKIGPPKADKSTLWMAAISICWFLHTPEPTKISPILPSWSIIPELSNTPISSPSSKEEIVSSKINKVDSPLGSILILKNWTHVEPLPPQTPHSSTTAVEPQTLSHPPTTESPPHTPAQSSTAAPFGMPAQSAHDELSPSHTPHSSTTAVEPQTLSHPPTTASPPHTPAQSSTVVPLQIPAQS